ncbi:MAG: type II toxin-antitoxin system RelE/ParE family toxin [Rhizobiaceae bacterium]|nr:type II toxin-antitoxin system RelE/ParE family toxin [Rhizobiaceae bacterium]MCV0405438.1 type II toxin-antitoxin system RelE/ParE family toxin [Rhizobiaceae bacterium]
MNLVEYVDDRGRSPFGEWFDRLPPATAARIVTGLARMEAENLTNAKAIGGGVSEYRMDFGPGFRIYFGRDGKELILLLAGGTKRRQDADIRAAQRRWQDYKARKAR